ncbi:MAG: hypothetical protein ABJB12_13120 [Pseudomonadota bacterium]
MKTSNYYLLILSALVPAIWLGACAGDDGKDGSVGPAGAQGPDGAPGATGETGPEGPAGPPGEPATDGIGAAGAAGAAGATGGPGAAGAPGAGGGSAVLETSCLGPCHGFNGIVEQWKGSTHYATFIANLGGDEVATWTGPQACGNCHALDAIEQRVAGNVTFTGAAAPNAAHGQLSYLAGTKVTESTYAGQSTVAEVSCVTCHDSSAAIDPHVTGKTYTPNSFPLRVPSGPDDQALLEKSSAPGVSDGTLAGKYTVGNACMWCHKSRKDVTNFITPTNNTLTSTHWGPHEGPQADIYTGLGGYHYAGQAYGNSSHQAFENGCVRCHMPDVQSNQGIGNHTFAPVVSTCTSAGCHTKAKNFDVGGGKTAMRAGIQELRVALNSKGWLTRSATTPYAPLTVADLADTQFSLDLTMPNVTGLTGDEAGAVYNYLILARGSADGVHNPLYVRQLIFDSVKAITGLAPVTLPARP